MDELRRMAGTRLAREIAGGVFLAGDAEILCEAVGACRKTSRNISEVHATRPRRGAVRH